MARFQGTPHSHVASNNMSAAFARLTGLPEPSARVLLSLLSGETIEAIYDIIGVCRSTQLCWCT